ncbi:mannose-1-phosphate guanylyltransferase/mannose-6-phosphate isomerase [Sulfurovum sp.]|uniref:mannose-1-phosphate guanylyltransferase/mannose-6-phosphate isomerase n=1 Tax=Sulfurovum sp. TaxID=1969726 RepID=UPI0026007B2A|nr:mannose-1-phosphate guanylyltransferase/mannose-6-phosphate isomerase [Sulfurovum sp.]
MTNIILCGGNGTRLWPLSRALMPKQFVKLFNDKSLFQLTVERNSRICERQYIVSNAEQYFLALDQLEALEKKNSQYLLEPIGRNTAPAIALACFSLNPEEIVLVTPSDHLIKNETAYARVLEQAKEFALNDALVTFGISPAFPETGFGYIEADGYDVKAFHEKPDAETAESYYKAGNYYWNSGMFCFKAGIFLDELQKYAPAIYSASLYAYENANKEGIMVRIKHQDMMKIPDNSIDYALMEKSDRVKVIPSDIGWSDVGSFDALAEELPNDENNNFILADKVVELVDIEDSIIVDTPDALLISKKGSSQKVKEVVTRLNGHKGNLTRLHNLVHRPWGTYEVLYTHENYKIKRIVVNPGKRLSLQKHLHRNEHWIVVRGEATVQVGDTLKTIYENESTYIEKEKLHRLSNKTDEPIVLIEAQVGSYTGEDDIIRIEDDYRRADNG